MKPGKLDKLLSETHLGIQLTAVLVFGVALSLVWDGATRWPLAWVIPLEGWITDFITWLKKDASIFGVQFKDITSSRTSPGVLAAA
jgi:hypothetical protein